MAGRFNGAETECFGEWKMIKTARTLVIITLALAIVSVPALAERTYAGAGAAPSGTGGNKNFTLGDKTFSINTINQVDATRLQEMGVHTVSVPAGKTVYVTYLNSAASRMQDFKKDYINMIVFGPNGFSSAGTYTGALPSNEPMPTYTFTGTSGQYYVITQRTDGVREMILVSVD